MINHFPSEIKTDSGRRIPAVSGKIAIFSESSGIIWHACSACTVIINIQASRNETFLKA